MKIIRTTVQYLIEDDDGRKYKVNKYGFLMDINSHRLKVIPRHKKREILKRFNELLRSNNYSERDD